MDEQLIEIEETLETVREFLPKLIEACESASDMFYVSVTDQTWELFGDVVQGMDDLYKTLQSLNNQLPEYKEPALLHSIVGGFVTELSERFAIMNSHMDDENYIAAADIIKYELNELFSRIIIHIGDSKPIKDKRVQENLRFLKNKFPHVYNKISDITPYSEKYQITYSQNATPNLYLPGEDGKAIYLYSQYDPRFEVKRWVDSLSLLLEDKPNVMIYGFGFGYHLEQLLFVHPDHQYYIYEPDIQIFLAAIRVIELEPLFSQLNIKGLAVGKGKNEIDQLFYTFMKKVKGETATLSLPIYDRIALDQKRKFIDDAKVAVLNFMYSKSIHHKFGVQWTRNRVYNMAVSIHTPSLLGLKGKLKGIPAVIVGAGPSLKEDIEYLRKLKDHAFIIAAGTTIQSLLFYGIEPHLIVSMDGGDPNYITFHNLNIDHIPFLYAPQIEYRIIEHKTSNVIHAFLANDLVTQVLMGVTHADPVFASNNSVTGTAIQAAIYMGCQEIIFTGQDLSYPEGEAYSPRLFNITKQLNEEIINSADLMVENVHGNNNRTTEGMALTLKDIEELLSQHPNVEFINCSSLGAKIEYTLYRPMSEVLEKLQNNHLAADFFQKAMKEQLTNYDESRKKSIIDNIKEVPERLQDMESTLEKIRSQLNKLPELSRLKPLKCINMMVAIEEEWGSVVKTIIFNTLFLTAIENDIHQFDRDLPEVASEVNVIKKADLFCKVLGLLVDTMLERMPEFQEMLEETIKRIEFRSKNVSIEVLR